MEYRKLSSTPDWSPVNLEVDGAATIGDKDAANKGAGILPQYPVCTISICLNDYDKVQWENSDENIEPDYLIINSKIQKSKNKKNHASKSRCEPVLKPDDGEICWKSVCAIWNETWNILKSDSRSSADGERKVGPLTFEGIFYRDPDGSLDRKLENKFEIFSFQLLPPKEPVPILTWANWGLDLRFETYGVVGQFYLPENRDVNDACHSLVFDIRPRFGDELYFHMLARVLGRGELQDRVLRAHASEHGSLFFLALFWLAAFEKAYRNGLPRLYVEKRDDRAALRGRMDIPRQLGNHLAGRRLDRVSCQFRELSFDNVIGRTLRRCNRVLRSIFRGTNIQAMRQLARADQLLAAQGVPLKRVSPRELDRIQYTSMAEIYQPLMKLSQALLSAAPERSGGELKAGKTFLFSMTDLWEYYLLEVLNEGLGRHGYSVATANEDPERRKKLLLSPSSEENKDNPVELFGLRPDILIEKDGATVGILDAKYKTVSEDAGTNYGVESGDVYQLTTYMTRYSGNNRGGMRAGALVYPWPIPWAFHEKTDREKPAWNHEILQWKPNKRGWHLYHGDSDNDRWNFGLIGFVLPVWAERFKVDEETTLPWNRPLIFHDLVRGETGVVLGKGWVPYCKRHPEAPLELAKGENNTLLVLKNTTLEENGYRRVQSSKEDTDFLDAIQNCEEEFINYIRNMLII